MRVLLITECYPSQDKQQYGVFIKQQFTEFCKLGNEMDIIVPNRGVTGKGLLFEKDITGDRYYLPYYTDRYELCLAYFSKKIAADFGALVEKNSYDIISVHIASDFILNAALIVGKKYHIPVVQHYHGLNVFSEYQSSHLLRQKFYGNRRKRILGKTTVVVGVSEKVSDIVKNSCPKVPVFTVYNGVNVQGFLPAKKSHSKFSIIGVGNLIPIKGFQYLVRAFAKIKSEIPQAVLYIIGDGVMREKLKMLAQELSVDDSVVFMGTLPYDSVSEQMRNADIFVLPSYYEALGCVYLEAMSCGLPTIGVKGMGIDEIIEDGVNGFLVSPHSVDEIADVILRLYQNEELRNQIGHQARITAEKFSWYASAEQLLEVYKGCINQYESGISHG